MRLKMNVVAVFLLVASIAAPAFAQNSGSDIYKSKCAMCHGADGAKIAAHDLSGATAQGMSDSDLSGIITNGKGKMPASKSLKPDQVAGLVAYVRTLKK